MKYLSFFIPLALSQIIPFDQTFPVLYSPIVLIDAGNEITYQLSKFRNSSCAVTITFQDPSLLPLTMSAFPKECPWDQDAKFKIPKSVPSGTIAVKWNCEGTNITGIDLLEITHGLGDYDMFLRDTKNATMVVECRGNMTGSSSY